MKKIIARIKGGLGNQLFCYAAARRLALANDAELVIDDVTGFARDKTYHRQYILDKFNINAKKATQSERMEPFGLGRRGLVKFISRRQPYYSKRYVEQEGMDFDARLLSFKVRGTIYLDGYWQSEKYFKDVEGIIRKDLQITPPDNRDIQKLAEQIRMCEAVAIHVRWFDPPGYGASHSNVPESYYSHAMDEMGQRVTSAHYFIFSDDPVATKGLFKVPPERLTYVDFNRGDCDHYLDLWMMSQCKHFIIANSTFGWWGAWLSEYESRIVIAPDININGKGAWGFNGLIPETWMTVR